ncbi:MAG: hypothetical protein M3Z37_06350, partial [Candidatus Eremiobacteraeota bacterium]|nr:hypothetical protein [Candidatus Eremiobacteraeota bacterium]
PRTRFTAYRTPSIEQMSLARLRFKIATSVAVAILGCLAFARLLSIEPVSLATALPFSVPLLLTMAGAWRGFIYWQTLRSAVKS